MTMSHIHSKLETVGFLGVSCCFKLAENFLIKPQKNKQVMFQQHLQH